MPPGAPNEVLAARAAAAPRGAWPRYWTGEQTYWTVVGAPGDDDEALMNTDGMIEVAAGGFSLEPFLRVDGRLVTWADAAATQGLAEGELPVPAVTWSAGAVRLRVTAFADGPPGRATLVVVYRVVNTGGVPADVDLFVAARPFQVLPPWQALNVVGGASPVYEIACGDGALRVHGRVRVVSDRAPTACGAMGGAEGELASLLEIGRVPARAAAEDPEGLAAAVLHYALPLAARAQAEVVLVAPFRPDGAAAWTAAAPVGARLARVRAEWRRLVRRVGLRVPPAGRPVVRALRSNLGWVLVNADGPAIRPGSRTYARSWIRDGAMTSAALLAMDLADPVRAFLGWYAGFRLPDGRVPCCVDHRGADPTPEHDSNGELIYAVAEYHRFTGDTALVRTLWPAVAAAAESIDALRQQRRTPAFRAPDRLPFFGLMPESISHEGYAKHPVHAYWDDFFALRGLVDAAALARVLGDTARAERFAAWRDEFRADVLASLARVMAERGLDYLPASVELADFDPSATAVAVVPGGELARLPAGPLRRTFDRYFDIVARRLGGATDWDAYTPYELRNVGVFVRLGQRERAWALLEGTLADRRPPAWNQWPEILWRDPAAPRFIGDMPHGWIGSTYVRAVRDLFAYEREDDAALVLAAGIPAAWIDAPGGVGVSRFPTWHGRLNYTARREAPGRVRVRIGGGVRVPPGGIVVQLPLPGPVRAVTENGRRRAVAGGADDVRIARVPADVVVEHAGPQARTGAAPHGR